MEHTPDRSRARARFGTGRSLFTLLCAAWVLLAPLGRSAEAAPPDSAAPRPDSARAAPDAGARTAAGPRLALSVAISEAITPASARFLGRAVDEAERRGAEILVIQLDTPGGLMDSMRDIVKRILASETPIAVYVSPPGSHAASAGVFVTLAAHVAAMAPGTNIGAAHPVNMGGGMDSTMTGKVTNDAVAYARSIARRRGRNEDWAERAVRESAALSSEAAVRENVIDFEAPTLDSLLALCEGREVTTAAGPVVLRTRGAAVETIEPTYRERLLTIITNPNVAYILMMIGIYGLIFELSNPGAVVPGVLGVISLLLALYAFQTLPLNIAGVLLMLFGIALLILEVKIISHGVLTLGGIAALLLGSLLLIRSPSPVLRISLAVIIPAVATTAAFFLFVVGAGLRAQRRRAVTGREGLIGARGVARMPLDPEGQVMVSGELWRARSATPVAAGEEVVVESIEGLLLRVGPARKEKPT